MRALIIGLICIAAGAVGVTMVLMSSSDMQNPKLGDASFAMTTICCNDHDWGDSTSPSRATPAGRR